MLFIFEKQLYPVTNVTEQHPKERKKVRCESGCVTNASSQSNFIV